ncbi:hypothetical protein Tco_1269134 [Tanacetum coccineum]
MVEPMTTTLKLHYYRRLWVLRDGEFEFWPTCDPTMKACNGGDRIYGLDEHGALKRGMKGRNMSFPDFLLVHGGTLYSWHNDGFEEEERWESGLDKKYYDLPKVYIETFEVKRSLQAKKSIIHLGL